jgi:hypothetical protein
MAALWTGTGYDEFVEIACVKCGRYSDSGQGRGLKEPAVWINFKEDGEDGETKQDSE